MFVVKDLMQTDLPNVRVGIGSVADSKHVESSVRALNKESVKIYYDPKKLVDDLFSGEIDAAVRGDMSSAELLRILKEKAEVSELERVVIMEPKNGRAFFMAPVGIDEGRTVEEKRRIAVNAIKLMRKMGAGTRIAVMSGGRIGDKGRNEAVDRSISDAEMLVSMLQKEMYDAYHAEILIESAVEEADLIIAPDGVIGNLIFRTLHFIGDAIALGAPVLNIDKVFVDTSRVKTDYIDSIILAMRLAEGRK
ncbi:MAG: methanogenesis marker protein Mmp4/MtxX [Candidatus Methanoplasma sp.]|jgi:putative methanogen marker protein 4|nr:methanogenesis marker protein Mmp4/MtxX [Candidatus Methanoplasma sp.]